MQTFLPLSDFQRSADVLDSKRRWKQLLEARQIVSILDGTNPNSGWKNHPAVAMWRGYLPALMLYTNTIHITILRLKTHNTGLQPYDLTELGQRRPKMPWWFGMKKFHAPHRSRLLMKDFEFYSQYGWKTKVGMDYWWPDPNRGGRC